MNLFKFQKGNTESSNSITLYFLSGEPTTTKPSESSPLKKMIKSLKMSFCHSISFFSWYSQILNLRESTNSKWLMRHVNRRFWVATKRKVRQSESQRKTFQQILSWVSTTPVANHWLQPSAFLKTISQMWRESHRNSSMWRFWILVCYPLCRQK